MTRVNANQRSDSTRPSKQPTAADWQAATAVAGKALRDKSGAPVTAILDARNEVLTLRSGGKSEALAVRGLAGSERISQLHVVEMQRGTDAAGPAKARATPGGKPFTEVSVGEAARAIRRLLAELEQRPEVKEARRIIGGFAGKRGMPLFRGIETTRVPGDALRATLLLAESGILGAIDTTKLSGESKLRVPWIGRGAVRWLGRTKLSLADIEAAVLDVARRVVAAERDAKALAEITQISVPFAASPLGGKGHKAKYKVPWSTVDMLDYPDWAWTAKLHEERASIARWSPTHGRMVVQPNAARPPAAWRKVVGNALMGLGLGAGATGVVGAALSMLLYSNPYLALAWFFGSVAAASLVSGVGKAISPYASAPADVKARFK